MQRKILEVLEKSYPYNMGGDDLILHVTGHPVDDDDFEKIASLVYNASYLKEHGLIELSLVSRGEYLPHQAQITHLGLDFIQDDGGLSAILNTVTVKFDAENLRDMIDQGLLQANIPEEKKGAIRKALKQLPAKALNTVVTDLLQTAMDDPIKAAKAVAGIVGIDIE
jgi:hypothetical protein